MRLALDFNLTRPTSWQLVDAKPFSADLWPKPVDIEAKLRPQSRPKLVALGSKLRRARWKRRLRPSVG